MKLTHTTYRTAIFHDLSPSVADTSEETMVEIECEPTEIPKIRESFIAAGFGDLAPSVLNIIAHIGEPNKRPPPGKKHEASNP